jgi:hypothetical protein
MDITIKILETKCKELHLDLVSISFNKILLFIFLKKSKIKIIESMN